MEIIIYLIVFVIFYMTCICTYNVIVKHVIWKKLKSGDRFYDHDGSLDTIEIVHKWTDKKRISFEIMDWDYEPGDPLYEENMSYDQFYKKYKHLLTNHYGF